MKFVDSSHILRKNCDSKFTVFFCVVKVGCLKYFLAKSEKQAFCMLKASLAEQPPLLAQMVYKAPVTFK